MEEVEYSGIILAGGSGKRMGLEKARLPLENSTFLDNIITKFKEIFHEIILVKRQNQQFEYPGVQTVSDIISNRGSMGGLYTGLYHSSNDVNFVCACDMPFVSLQVIQFLLTQFSNVDAVIPKVNGYLEPLYAVYSKDCTQKILTSLRIGDLRITNLYTKMNTKIIDDNKICKIDPHLLSFYNINTKSDYDEAIYLYKNLPGN